MQVNWHTGGSNNKLVICIQAHVSITKLLFSVTKEPPNVTSCYVNGHIFWIQFTGCCSLTLGPVTKGPKQRRPSDNLTLSFRVAINFITSDPLKVTLSDNCNLVTSNSDASFYLSSSYSVRLTLQPTVSLVFVLALCFYFLIFSPLFTLNAQLVIGSKDSTQLTKVPHVIDSLLSSQHWREREKVKSH